MFVFPGVGLISFVQPRAGGWKPVGLGSSTRTAVWFQFEVVCARHLEVLVFHKASGREDDSLCPARSSPAGAGRFLFFHAALQGRSFSAIMGDVEN